MVTFCKPKDRENPWVVFSFQKDFEMVQHLVQKILHCFLVCKYRTHYSKKRCQIRSFHSNSGMKEKINAKNTKLTKCVCNIATETCSSSLNHPSYPKKKHNGSGSVLHVRLTKNILSVVGVLCLFLCVSLVTLHLSFASLTLPTKWLRKCHSFELQ